MPMPSESFETRPFTFEATGKAFERPVIVDVFSGRVYEFPKENVIVPEKGGVRYLDVPVYDSPCVLTERSAIDSQTPDSVECSRLRVVRP